MKPATPYINRDAAIASLIGRGFNRHDIECVLDLTGPVMQGSTPLWPAKLLERVAARAWWLKDGDEASVFAAAAA